MPRLLPEQYCVTHEMLVEPGAVDCDGWMGEGGICEFRPHTLNTRDGLLAEIERSIRETHAERAGEIMRELERRLPKNTNTPTFRSFIAGEDIRAGAEVAVREDGLAYTSGTGGVFDEGIVGFAVRDALAGAEVVTRFP